MIQVRWRGGLVVLVLVAASLAAIGPASAQVETCFGEEVTHNVTPEVPFVGTDADEVIMGTPGADDIHGGGGADLICGLGGADILRGGFGRDQIRAGRGGDTVLGGPGNDIIIGGPGNDELHGNGGADDISGSRGADVISGGAGHDRGAGGPGPDAVSGDNGRDSLLGGPNNDELDGGSGPDDMFGGKGHDFLDGGPGVDALDGGNGRDTCINGRGLTRDTSCLRGFRLSPVGTLGDRAGLVTAPPGDERLFVVEQYHGIRIFKDGELLDTPFLNLTGSLATGNEQGVLGLAFHPNYEENGRFFVNYTRKNGDTRIVEYARNGENPDRAVKSSARTVLLIDQPHRWHNGGHIAFGPDGYLYIGMGDGGPGFDPNNSGQDTTTLLGGLLRIDVDGDLPYVVPEDNPFVGKPGADELWASGLRNPWRFSFDEETNRTYIGDVGQSVNEEINVVASGRAGVNYGWRVIEGTTCHIPAFGCNTSGMRAPTVNIPHSTGACSVIGGHVYRGEVMPELDGHYFYSDFCTRNVNTLLFDSGAVSERTRWITVPAGASGGDALPGQVGGAQSAHAPPPNLPLGSVVSMGRDGFGELYVATIGGAVYKIEPLR
ncbi:MAG: PQQ-dependent sugar dehydrogenase [Acidimicrobiales bacterium]